jgi:hypothetical protein
VYGPVESLTDDELHLLLEVHPSPEYDFGCELLNADLSVAEDISADMQVGGDIEWVGHRTVHRRVSGLRLTRSLRWGADLVRPYFVIAAGGVEARWNRGVFIPTVPERTIGTVPEVHDVDGEDRLSLLRREVDAAYTVTAGLTYREMLLTVFTDAGLGTPPPLIDGAAADDTIPTSKTYPLVGVNLNDPDPDQESQVVTWLRIVNDLLRAINFRGVWCDENGRFRCLAYQAPSVRPPEWVFDADDEQRTIVGEEQRISENVRDARNKWVFIWTNRPGGAQDVEGDGKYTVDRSDVANGDRLGRTLVYPRRVEVETASQAKLVDYGDRFVGAEIRVPTLRTVETGPFPGAGHFDVFSLVAEGITRKVMARSWRMPLAGGNVEWEWEVVG